jgi:hypothetical protein
VLPEEILQKISTSYRRTVAPRPNITVFPELRTVEPVIDDGWYGVICHNYIVADKGILVQVFIRGNRPYAMFVDQLHERIAQLYIPLGGKSGILHVPGDVYGRIFDAIAAAYLVGQRYNFDLMACRLTWKQATRKQKSVRRLLWDQQPVA